MPDWVLFFVVVIGIPVVMGVLKDMHSRSLKHRERRMEIEAQMTAEKAAQYAVKPKGWSNVCACWSGS
jgi:hypothetical protein